MSRIFIGIVWFFIFQGIFGFVSSFIFKGPVENHQVLTFAFGLCLPLILAIVGTKTGKLPGTGKKEKDLLGKK